jgi:hypothetical protein
MEYQSTVTQSQPFFSLCLNYETQFEILYWEEDFAEHRIAVKQKVESQNLPKSGLL